MLDRVDNIDMHSLSLAKCHKMSFDHTGATVIGMEKAVDDTFATENTIMAMLQEQKVKVKFEHRSEGKFASRSLITRYTTSVSYQICSCISRYEEEPSSVSRAPALANKDGKVTQEGVHA